MVALILVLLLCMVAGCGDDESTSPSNHAPVVSAVTVSPSEVEPRGWATITVIASDPDQDALVYSYQVSGGFIGANDPIAVWNAPAVPGKYVAVATVRDPSGIAASGTDTLTVLAPNHAPTIAHVEVSPPSVLPGGTATITVTASDPDGDLLSFTYEPSGGTVIGDGAVGTWDAPLTHGNYTVLATVRDSRGLAATGTGTLEVAVPNRAPVISHVIVNPSSVNAGQSVMVTVGASDPDGDTMAYAYQGPGTILPNGAMATWTPPSVQGSHTITVTVRDPDGLTSSPTLGYVTVTVPQQQTGITGTGTLQVGMSGDLSNARVAYYQNFGDWAAGAPVAFVGAAGSGASVTFTLITVPPGTYYLDFWKDVDNDTVIDAGDFFGWYGSGSYPLTLQLTPFAVTQGNMTNLGVITVYAL